MRSSDPGAAKTDPGLAFRRDGEVAMQRGWPVVLFILSLLVLVALAAGPVRADEAHGAADHKPGIFDWALDLGVWTLVVFLVLLYVLKKFAWGPMLEGLQKREHNIQAAIDEARRAREEAQRLREEFQHEMDHAQEKVRDLLDAGRRDAQRAADELLGKARGECQTERDRARREIELARDQALHQLWNQAAQMASVVSAKAIRRQLTPDDHRRLVDEALAELKHSGVSGNGGH
jgi:F-type H+-transporting ATPase subunit b